MFDRLTALGWGIVTFSVTIGVGIVLLEKFGSAVASCPTLYPTYDTTTGHCENSTGSELGGTGGIAAVNTFYIGGQLGTSGLAGWTPAIIAFAVGMLFLGAFLVGGNRQQ